MEYVSFLHQKGTRHVTLILILKRWCTSVCIAQKLLTSTMGRCSRNLIASLKSSQTCSLAAVAARVQGNACPKKSINASRQLITVDISFSAPKTSIFWELTHADATHWFKRSGCKRVVCKLLDISSPSTFACAPACAKAFPTAPTKSEASKFKA